LYPVLFQIGEFKVYSYGVMLGLAFAVGIYFVMKEAPRHGINREHLVEAFIIIIVLAIIGSRLAYVILFWDSFSAANWWRILDIRGGGHVFYGGLFASLLGAILYCRYRKTGFFMPLDLVTPYIALGYSLTRIGCFLNGCCYGTVTDLPWGVVFPVVDGLTRHPTQLYSSAATFLIFLLLLRLKERSYFDGYVFALFLVFYGIYRFAIEFFRVEESLLWFMTVAQLTAALMVAGGLLALLWHKREIGKKLPAGR